MLASFRRDRRRLVAPRVPPWPRAAREHFQARRAWEHFFDQLGKGRRLFAMIAARQFDSRRMLLAWRWCWHLTARADQQQLVDIAVPIAGSGPGFSPDKVGFVIEPPRLHDGERLR